MDYPQTVVRLTEAIQIQIPMEFVIHNNAETTEMFLIQELTPHAGGLYTPKRGYKYYISKKNPVGIQRIIVNFKNFDKEVDNLIQESNRFLYMYCKL